MEKASNLPRFKFSLKYFLLTILLFILEILIATTFKNVVFLRSYFGDVLVVILIYTFILSFVKLEKAKLIFWIFVFSCLIEFLQYFHIGEMLGFGNNKLMMIVLGNSFSWIDILCYGIGCVLIWFLDIKLKIILKSVQK